MRISNFYLIALTLLAMQSYSQVGIGTRNPQGIFHVDGAKDNPSTGSPNATQADNDFNVNNLGQVGVGMLPTGLAKLEINGQIKITGGLPGTDKILESNNVGLANWRNVWRAVWFNFTATVSGQLTGGTTNSVGSGGAVAVNSFTVPVNGVYKITLTANSIYSAAPGDANFQLTVNAVVNGSLLDSKVTVADNARTHSGVRFLVLNANDVISTVRQSSGTTLTNGSFEIELVDDL